MKFRFKAVNEVSDDKGDTSTSWSLPPDRSSVRNLTSKDANIKSCSSSHKDKFKLVREVRDDRGDTSLSCQLGLDMSKLVKEVRADRGDTSLSFVHTPMFKLVKEVRDANGDTSTSCPHPTNCKVSNATRDDRGDTSASWPRGMPLLRVKFIYKAFNEFSDDKGDTSTSCGLQFDRSKVCSLTSDDNSLTSTSSSHEDRSRLCRQAHNLRAVWLTPNRLGMARPGRKLNSRRVSAEGNATKLGAACAAC